MCSLKQKKQSTFFLHFIDTVLYMSETLVLLPAKSNKQSLQYEFSLLLIKIEQQKYTKVFFCILFLISQYIIALCLTLPS